MAGKQQIALPVHVGIIMDGNGRWAKKRMLPRNMGHKQGANTFGQITKYAAKIGIKYLSVYAFSTENWKRSPEEIKGIMNLLRAYLKDVEQYRSYNIQVKIIGDTSPMDDDIKEQIVHLEQSSAQNTGMVLNIALGYGGQNEVVQAVRQIAQKVQNGEISDIDIIDKSVVADHLYTAQQPEVDLLIRTSGEKRISNFLLWQSAYAEFVFTDVLWPDFSTKDFDRAIEEFASRKRTMGGV